MKNHDKILKIIGIILTSVIVVGIIFMVLDAFNIDLIPTNYSDNKDIRKIEKNAESLAKEYIKNKYNIKFKVTGFETSFWNEEDLYDLFVGHGRINEPVLVYMNSNGKDFIVAVEGSKVLGDTYQEAEIEEAIYNYYLSLAGEEPYSYNIYFGNISKSDYIQNNYVTEYFTGNVKEFLRHTDISLRFNYIQHDNIDNSFNIEPKNVYGSFAILNFNSTDDEKNMNYSNGYTYYSSNPTDYFYKMNAIKESLLYTQEDRKYQEYISHDFNDLFYALGNNSDNITISKRDFTAEEIQNFNDYRNRETRADAFDGIYTIEGKLTDNFYLYFPKTTYSIASTSIYIKTSDGFKEIHCSYPDKFNYYKFTPEDCSEENKLEFYCFIYTKNDSE